MATRPLHLRWIYVKDHGALFAVLLALLGVAVSVVMAAAEDPARGLALGALPAMFLMTVWMLTNNAGYVDRTPETLPHERPLVTDAATAPEYEPSPAIDGDPFAARAEPDRPTSTKRAWKKAPPIHQPAAPNQSEAETETSGWDPFEDYRGSPAAPSTSSEPAGEPIHHPAAASEAEEMSPLPKRPS